MRQSARLARGRGTAGVGVGGPGGIHTALPHLADLRPETGLEGAPPCGPLANPSSVSFLLRRGEDSPLQRGRGAPGRISEKPGEGRAEAQAGLEAGSVEPGESLKPPRTPQEPLRGHRDSEQPGPLEPGVSPRSRSGSPARGVNGREQDRWLPGVNEGSEGKAGEQCSPGPFTGAPPTYPPPPPAHMLTPTRRGPPHGDGTSMVACVTLVAQHPTPPPPQTWTAVREAPTAGLTDVGTCSARTWPGGRPGSTRGPTSLPASPGAPPVFTDPATGSRHTRRGSPARQPRKRTALLRAAFPSNRVIAAPPPVPIDTCTYATQHTCAHTHLHTAAGRDVTPGTLD